MKHIGFTGVCIERAKWNGIKKCNYLRGAKSSYLLDIEPSQRRVITCIHIKHKMYKNNSAYSYSRLIHTNR